MSSDQEVSSASDSDIDDAEESQQQHIGVDLKELNQAVTHTEAEDLCFKLCGDNIDKTVRRRFIRADDEGMSSLHYFHLYGVADRVRFNHLSPVISSNPRADPQAIMKRLLPTKKDDEELHNNFKILLSRILANHTEIFKFGFSDVVSWHITHKYSQQMSEKSKVVSKFLRLITPCNDIFF